MINVPASYTFIFKSSLGINSTNYLNITFPKQIQVQNGNRNCLVSSINDNNLVINSCFASGNIITILFNNAISSLNEVTIKVIDGLINPISLYSDALSFQSYSNLKTLIDSINTMMAFTSTVLNAKISTSSQLASMNANFTIIIITQQIIPKGGMIRLIFPNFNDGSGSSSIDSIINSTVAIQSNSIIGINSSSKLSVSNMNTLYIINVCPTADLPNYTNITLTILNIINPPSLKPLSGYHVSTLDGSRNSIEDSQTLALTITVPNYLRITITSANRLINSQTILSLFCKTSSFVPKDAVIVLILPNDFNTNSIINIQGKENLVPVIDFSKVGQNITLKNGFSNYYTKGNIHGFSILSLINPPNTKPTQKFIVCIFSSDNYLMHINDPNFEVTYSSLPGNLLSMKYTAVSTEINKKTTYTVSFQNSNLIPPGSYIKLIFPEQMSITNFDASTCKNIISGISLNSQCSVINNSVLWINNCCSSGIPSNTLISFSIQNITNPTMVFKNIGISIASLSSDNYYIDKSTLYLYFSEGDFSLITIVPSSFKVWELSTYNITLILRNSLPIDSKILITFPVDVNIEEPVLTMQGCSYIDSLSNIFKGICTLNSDLVSISILNFNTNKTIPSGTQISIKLPFIRNPRSLQITSSFSILTMTNDNLNIDKNYNPQNISMMYAAQTQNVLIIPESLIVGSLTNYEMTILPKSKIISGDMLVLTFPLEIRITSTLNIIGLNNIRYNLQYNLSNINTNNQMIIVSLEFDSSFILNNCFILSIQNLINPGSLKPSNPIILKIQDKLGYTIENYSAIINVTMKIPGILKQTQIKQVVSPQSQLISDYYVSFITQNRIKKNSKIIVNYPNQLSIVEAKCESLININSSLICQNDPNSRNITITNGYSLDLPENSIVNFIIKNMKFTSLVTEDNFTIDLKADSLNIVFPCFTPCATCLSDLVTCTSCLITSDLQIYFQNRCISSCPDGYFAQNYQCFPCNPVCKTCLSNNINYCLTCQDNFPINISYGKKTRSCVNKCPEGYYNNKNNCLKCMLPCQNCEDLNQCTNCYQNSTFPYFYKSNKKCVFNCPIGTYNDNNTCYDCDELCINCLSSTYCIECKEGFNFFQNSCLNKCPDGYLPILGSCQICSKYCKKCAIILGDCEICSEGYVLLNNKCVPSIVQCSNGYFYNFIQNKCLKCITNCKSCRSNATCDDCIDGFYRENLNCVKGCSSGYTIDPNTQNKTCMLIDKTLNFCNENQIFYNYNCLNKCPESKFYNIKSRTCDQCDITCIECITLLNCTKCSEGFKNFNHSCHLTCPEGTELDIFYDNICKQKKTIISINSNFYSSYFIYFGLTVNIIISTVLIKRIYPKTFFSGSNMAFISIISFFQLIQIMVNVFIECNYYYLIFMTYIVILILFLNIFFVEKVIKGKALKDKKFLMFSKGIHRKYFRFILYLSRFIDFKIFRLIYSRYAHLDLLSAKFDNFDNSHKPFINYLVFDILFLEVPIAFFNGTLIMTRDKDSFWYLSLEYLVITLIKSVFEFSDIVINVDLNIDYYNQESQNIEVKPYNYLKQLEKRKKILDDEPISNLKRISKTFSHIEFYKDNILEEQEKERHDKAKRKFWVRRRFSLNIQSEDSKQRIHNYMINNDPNSINYKLLELKNMLESIEKGIKEKRFNRESTGDVLNEGNCFSNLLNYTNISSTHINNCNESEFRVSDNSSLNLINALESKSNILKKSSYNESNDEYIIIKHKNEFSIGKQPRDNVNTPQFKKFL